MYVGVDSESCLATYNAEREDFCFLQNKYVGTVTLPQQERQNQYTIEDTSPRSAQSLTHNHLLFLNMMDNKKDENNKENDHIVDVNFNRLNGQQQRKQPHYQRRHKQILTTGLKGEHDGLNKDFLKLPSRPPYFDFGMPRNITARSGQTAAITCRVENLGDKSVSWIRKRDLHILTAGILTYTSDERFKVVRTGGSKNWSLHIRYAQPRDSGIYECQVNTEPKISMAFRLNVVVTPPDAKAFISGPMDLYVKVGSAITLTCHVKQPSSMHDIGPIHWYRGPYILTPFAVHPNDAAIDMQRISMESKLGDKLQSRLRISNVQLADTGNYTCMPTTAELASVTVNVINAIIRKSGGYAKEYSGILSYFITTTTTTAVSQNSFNHINVYVYSLQFMVVAYEFLSKIFIIMMMMMFITTESRMPESSYILIN
uniref:Ig-like domain-containing protein n=1 Tax=Glossina palpalis gambiensis TaxID=67801 RepID=A0A1B0BX28_9MUSC